MIDWLTRLWVTYGPHTIYDWQTVAACAALLSSLVFVALYSTVTWWKGQTGRNLMSMGAALVLLASGSVVRRLLHVPTGHIILLVGWTFVALVMAWRTRQMWHTTHPRNAPPPTPTDPTPPTDRSWYAPTPHSVIEPPRPKEQ